jgi:hypothetical protein
MELSQRTVEILNNFNVINPLGLVFPEGNTLTHMPAKSMNIIAVAEIDETIEQRFAVFNISQLLNCIRSFDTPQIVVDNLKIFISDVNKIELGEFVISSASEAVIKPTPKIKFPESSTQLSFQLTKEMYKLLLKGIAIVEAPSVALIGDGEQMFFTGLDENNSGKSEYKLPIGDTSEKFRYVFPLDTLNKLMQGMDYTVSIAAAPTGVVISRFAGDRLTYYLAIKANKSS